MLGFWKRSMPWKIGWKYAIKMEGIFGMVNVGCWNFGHKEGWPHPSPFLIHIQVPPFSSLIYICPNSLFKFCPEFICQEKLKICCCKACQHLFRPRLHACPQDLCLREGVKNHLPPRQHCRLSICLYFDWVWQILSGGCGTRLSIRRQGPNNYSDTVRRAALSNSGFKKTISLI